MGYSKPKALFPKILKVLAEKNLRPVDVDLINVVILETEPSLGECGAGGWAGWGQAAGASRVAGGWQVAGARVGGCWWVLSSDRAWWLWQGLYCTDHGASQSVGPRTVAPIHTPPAQGWP